MKVVELRELFESLVLLQEVKKLNAVSEKDYVEAHGKIQAKVKALLAEL